MSDDVPGPAHPGTPPPAPLPGPPPGPPVDLLATLGVTAPELVRAATVGALSYVVAWVGGAVCTVLALLTVLIEDGSDEISWSWLATAPAQLVAMSFRSPADLSSTSTDSDMVFTSSVAVTAPLYSVLVIALGAVYVLSRRDRRSVTASAPSAATLAVTSAVVFVLVAFLAAAIVSLSFDDPDATSSVSAAEVELVLFGLAGVSVTALLARRPWSVWRVARVVPEAVGSAWRSVGAHVAVFTALVVPTAVVWLIVEGAAAGILVLPELLVNVVAFAMTLGHVGALDAAGGGVFFGEESTESELFWFFTGSEWSLLVLLPFAVVATVASALVLHARRRGAPQTGVHYAATAIVFGVVGGLITVLSTVSGSFGSDVGFAGDVSYGPVPWYCLVLALWGLAAEAMSRVAGGLLAAVVPDRWVAAAAGRPRTVAPGPAGPPPPPPSADGSSTTLTPGTKRALIGVAVLAVVGIVGFVGVAITNSVAFGPEERAEEYFQALADGDAEKALDLAAIDLPRSERQLLTNAVLRGSADRIEDIRVGDVETSGGAALVTVTYSIGGDERSQEISLRESGSRYGVFDDWEVVDPQLGGVYVYATGATSLEVNGEEFEVEDLDDGVSLRLYPGTYEIVAASGDRYLSFEPERVTISGDEESLDFEGVPSDDLVEEVTAQLDAFLADCIARTEIEPDGCPNTAYRYEVTDVRWTLDEAPTYEITIDYDGEGFLFDTDERGRATVTGKEASFLPGEPPTDFTDTVRLSLYGSVDIDDGEVAIDVESVY